MTTKADMVASAKDTESHLLDCALTVFAEKGYAAASVRDLIRAAGVTQPTLYYYWPGKLALFRELIRLHYETTLAGLTTAVEQADGCEARLRVIIEQSFAFCAADLRVPRLMFQTAFGPRIAKVTDDIDALGYRRFQLVRGVMTAGIESEELTPVDADGLALAFCSLMDHHLNVLSRHDNAAALLSPELADWLLTLFLRGALIAR